MNCPDREAADDLGVRVKPLFRIFAELAAWCGRRIFPAAFCPILGELLIQVGGGQVSVDLRG